MSTGSISIFALDFSGTKFACSRSFAGGYILQAGEFTVSLTPTIADALAAGAMLIRSRAQTAVRTGKELRPGRTFARDLLAVDGRTVHIELGVADSGDGVYIEVGGTRMTLTDEQAATLLAVLGRLSDDVATVQRATEPPGLDLGVAASLRGFAYPWERDPSW